jgi:hypothetical protein
MSAKNAMVKVRLLFVDDGSYHHEEVDLPVGDMAEYERLIDFVREDPGVLKRVHVDLDRLCAAYLVE